MKILIHYHSKRQNKGLLLVFHKMTIEEVREIIQEKDRLVAIGRLVVKADKVEQVPQGRYRRIRASADFVVSERYTMERLG
ncbi:MAG: hypothetical protein HYZ52_06315 [Candidatus Omnitrophica bacterium]|nr:hypothetical protein [Candidatus Omnitrophota bacterium]